MAGPYYFPATNTYIYSYFALQKAFPTMSLPENVDIPDIGAYILQYTEQPEFDPDTQYVDNGTPELREDGRYYQVWVIYNYEVDPPEEGNVGEDPNGN